MNTIKVAIFTIAATTLSGCATGYYQRGYVGHGSTYSSPGYYRSYERGYASPGTSITFGRNYIQPNYRRDYEHDENHNWHAPSEHFDRHEGRYDAWQNRDFGRQNFARDYSGQGIGRERSAAEPRERGSGWRGRYRRQDD